MNQIVFVLYNGTVQLCEERGLKLNRLPAIIILLICLNWWSITDRIQHSCLRSLLLFYQFYISETIYVIDSFNLKRELQKLQSCNDYSVIFIDHYRFYKSLKRNNIHSIFLSMDVHLFSNSLFNSLNAKVVSYWNQATDLRSKLIDWFLYGGNVGL